MQTHFRQGTLVALLVLAFVAGCKDMGTDPAPQSTPPPETPPPAQGISFSQRVLPIFQRHGCTGCHGGTNGLTVGTVAQLLAGGNSGPAIIAGKADSSTLVRKLSVSPPFGERMPQGGPYLPDTTIAVVRSWINEGAKNN